MDFIETEEDAEAVESAVVKIQSTFRGKKIRSKLSQKPAEASKANEKAEKSSSKGGADPVAESSVDKDKKSNSLADSKNRIEADDEELNKKVSTMQVNDNNEIQKQAANVS